VNIVTIHERLDKKWFPLSSSGQAFRFEEGMNLIAIEIAGKFKSRSGGTGGTICELLKI
jgi:hypothetical protein